MVNTYIKNQVKKFMMDESGDTNFISIIIILAIVVVLVGVFIGFRDKILGAAQSIIDSFTKDDLEYNGEG